MSRCERAGSPLGDSTSNLTRNINVRYQTHFDFAWSYLNVHNPNWNSRKSMECWWTERSESLNGINSNLDQTAGRTMEGKPGCIGGVQ